MSEVLASVMLIILLNAARRVSVILLASPQKRNNEVIRINGIRFPGATSFSLIFTVFILLKIYC